MKHNFDGDIQMVMNTKKSLAINTIDVKLTYLAPPTVNEIQSILIASQTCYQIIKFKSRDCVKATTWTAINGDVWDYTKMGTNG